MAKVGTSAVKIIDHDGDVATVTSNRLDVNATLVAGATIDIGDVEVLGHGTVGHFGLNIRTVGGGGSGPTQLTSNACKHADIMAHIGNSDKVYIGGSGVTAHTGICLYPGDVYSVDITDTSLLYALPVSDNDDICVVYYV